MKVTEAAVEAAAKELRAELFDSFNSGTEWTDYEHEARAALTAAIPLCEQEVAGEVAFLRGVIDAALERATRAEAALAAVERLLDPMSWYEDDVVTLVHNVRRVLDGAQAGTETHA